MTIQRISCSRPSAAIILSCAMLLSPACDKKDTETVEIPELNLEEGQTVRAIMETVTENGKVTITGGQQSGGGEMMVQRVRIFEKTRTADGYIYDIQKNDSVAHLQWQGQEFPSETHTALRGRPVRAANSADGWKLVLAEGNASEEQDKEIKSFEAYANRQWLPDHPVKVGDSWPCEAGFLQHFIQTELAETETRGTLTLMAVEKNNAAISVNIQGEGQEVDDKGTISKAQINLIGTLVYSIKTGLDIGLDLKGNVTSGVQNPNGEIKAVMLPITIKVRKKIMN